MTRLLAKPLRPAPRQGIQMITRLKMHTAQQDSVGNYAGWFSRGLRKKCQEFKAQTCAESLEECANFCITKDRNESKANVSRFRRNDLANLLIWYVNLSNAHHDRSKLEIRPIDTFNFY